MVYDSKNKALDGNVPCHTDVSGISSKRLECAWKKMSVQWDVPKTLGQQHSDGRGPKFIRQFVSFYRRKYFISCELRNIKFKQKLRSQSYYIQNITSLLFMK